MKLSQSLEGKRIRLVDNNGEVFEGTVADYIYPEDNEPEGMAAIDVYNCPQRPGLWLGFNESDIKSIEIICN